MTFLRLLLRESLPTDGTITVGGKNLALVFIAGMGVGALGGFIAARGARETAD